MPMDLQENIRQFSQSMGVHDIGFCHAAPFLEDNQVYVERLDYQVRDAKCFIAIVLAYNPEVDKLGNDRVNQDTSDEVSHVGLGKMAIGTNFCDYHILVQDKLKLILDYIEKTHNGKGKAFCDISPFSDRGIARRCGLGTIGRNGFLIHPVYGTYCFIGYILTDLELIEAIEDNGEMVTAQLVELDIDNDCGACRLCQKQCPAQAILGNGLIDETLCISALSQNKQLDENFDGNRLCGYIYGCDICQRVCPRNHKVHQVSCQLPIYEAIVPRRIAIERLLQETNQSFKVSFGKTASGWRGKKVLIRNAYWAKKYNQRGE